MLQKSVPEKESSNCGDTEILAWTQSQKTLQSGKLCSGYRVMSLHVPLKEKRENFVCTCTGLPLLISNDVLDVVLYSYGSHSLGL